MKQHITAEQLNELSEKQKEKLRKWWKPGKGDFCVWNGLEEESVLNESGEGYYEDLTDPEFNKKEHLLLLSIGQMIEFLTLTERLVIFISEEDYKWNVGSCFDNPDYESEELCDALWEAVKEVLNE